MDETQITDKNISSQQPGYPWHSYFRVTPAQLIQGLQHNQNNPG